MASRLVRVNSVTVNNVLDGHVKLDLESQRRLVPEVACRQCKQPGKHGCGCRIREPAPRSNGRAVRQPGVRRCAGRVSRTC
jgi:hypothetical protein